MRLLPMRHADAKNKNIAVNTTTLNTVLKGLCDEKRLDDALALFAEMRHADARNMKIAAVLYSTDDLLVVVQCAFYGNREINGAFDISIIKKSP